MARPPLALGHHGAIKVTRGAGQWVARCRVRDLDGVTRRVARWGSSRTAAQRALQDELRQRRGERTELLRPESRFKDAATLWMGKITARREDSTADTYRHWLNGLILPQLGDLQLHECDVAHIDARQCCTRPSPPTQYANWNASSPPRVTARLPRAD